MDNKFLKKHIFESGKLNSNRTHSYYIEKHFSKIYHYLTKGKNYTEQEFKELLYKFIFNIKDPPKCKNPECSNSAIFLKFSRGYSNYCSYECGYKNFGSNNNALKRIRESQQNIRNKKILEDYSQRFPNIKIIENYIIIPNYCNHGDLNISIKDFKNFLNNNTQTLCKKCYNYYIKEWIPNSSDIDEQHSILLNMLDKSKYNITEKRIKKYYPKLYRSIILNTPKDSTWSEKIYMFKNNIIRRPICINCGLKETHFLESIHEYSKHCHICCEKGDFLIQHKKFISNSENNLANWISSFYKDKILRNQKMGNIEMDIYLPDLNLGFEFNGLYWHSEKYRDKFYHYNKMKFFGNKGIKIINIWEDDWEFKRDIIKSIILNKIGFTPQKIYARKTEIRRISSKENKKFFDENHLQGGVSASIRIGLYYNDDLVSVMTFGKKRKILAQNSANNEYELLRFANKININVIGGASKLFSYFINNYNPQKIISYANCDISDGKLYKILGFKEIGHTGVNYWWVKGKNKYHRSNFMKHKLIADGFDPEKTESEIMTERGYYKLYGSGNLKYEWGNI